MKNKLIVLFLIFIVSSCQKDLSCSDFKEGTFSMRTKNRNFTIVRKGNIQIEFKKGIKSKINTESIRLILDWVDDCSYRLKFDESKMILKDHEKYLNDNDGILVEIIRIKGNCMDYNSKMITKEGKTIEQKGSICKEF